MRRKIILFALSVLLLFFCSASVFAEEFDENKIGSISVTLQEKKDGLAIVGAELSVYYVATVQINSYGNLNYQYREEFEGCGIALDDPELSEKLDAYVSHNSIQALKIVTDEEGKAACYDLPLGLYFVKQTGEVEGFALCSSFLVTVPVESDGKYIYDVNASPKTEAAKLISITVKKVWNADEEDEIPQQITVKLLRGETVVETAVLHEGNHWEMTFRNLPETDSYSIREVAVPKGFTATYSQSGYVFTVTNTSSLIVTGQLVWPIPVLVGIGMLFTVVGLLLQRKKRTANG